MQFPPDVERWRSTVAKYFPPELVDKALWVIQYESGGNPNAVGDGGAARGLFQIQDSRNFSSRPSADYLDNPENNIKYAAQQLGAASGKWTDWGEGSTYQGKPFGALGNHPFPGSATNGRASTAGGITFDIQGNGGADMPSGASGDVLAQLNAQLSQLIMAGPPDPGTLDQDTIDLLRSNGILDPASYLQSQWIQDIGRLTSAIKQIQADPSGADPAQTEFENKLAESQQKIALGNLDLNRATAEINRFLEGQQESRSRAQMVADAQKEAIAYGTTPGKSSFSLNDLGAVFGTYSKLLGVDPNAPFLNYSGTQTLDPMADLAAGDAALGVTGQIPGVPAMPSIGVPSYVPSPASGQASPLGSALGAGGFQSFPGQNVLVQSGPLGNPYSGQVALNSVAAGPGFALGLSGQGNPSGSNPGYDVPPSALPTIPVGSAPSISAALQEPPWVRNKRTYTNLSGQAAP